MGLEEKRWLKTHQTETLPKYQAELKELSGCDITYEVDWDSFASDLEAMQNLEYQGFGRFHDAMRSICRDEVGKEAVREGIKKVKVKNVDDPAKKKVTLSGGVVEYFAAWGKSGYFTDSEIISVLEKGL